MTTIYYASINDARTMLDVAHSGTSGTAGDVTELRMGNGTYVPTQEEVLLALRLFERWIVQGGLNSAGANLSPTTG